MVKVQGPMFTITASGTVGDALEFMKWRGSDYRKPDEKAGIAYVRSRRLGKLPNTPQALAMRETLSAGVSAWHNDSLVPAEYRNSWASAGSGLGLSGFNRYVQKFVETNPQRQPPWNIPSPG